MSPITGEDTVAGRLAARLAADGQPTGWSIHARGGLTARGVTATLARPELADDVRRADVVVVSVGVNDLLRLWRMPVWRRDLEVLLTRLRSLSRGSIVLIGMPPVDAFPALPGPARKPLGYLAARMDRAGRDVACRFGVRHVELGAELLDGEGAFAADGFHPSAKSHDRLAELVVAALDLPSRGDDRATR